MIEWQPLVPIGVAIVAPLILWLSNRHKKPIDESTAAYANAKVLTDAAGDLVTSMREEMGRMREDLARVRADLDMIRTKNDMLGHELEDLRRENAELREENHLLWDWIEQGAVPPPPQRKR